MAIIYMRFKVKNEEGYAYFVGADKEAILEDTQDGNIFGRIQLDPTDFGAVNSEVVTEAVSRDPGRKDWRTWRELLNDGVAAARAGCPSYYLFG